MPSRCWAGPPGCRQSAPLTPSPPRGARRPAHHVLGVGRHREVEDGGEAEGLGFRAVPGRLDETGEVGIGHAGDVDAERFEFNCVDALFAIGAAAVSVAVAHAELTGRDVRLLDAVRGGAAVA